VLGERGTPALTARRDAGVSIGTQLAWQLKHQIESGLLAPGARLPGVRAAAKLLRVNVNTVRAVYADLEAQGYVHARHGSGTFVADQPPERDRSAELRALMDRTLAEAGRMGFDATDVAAAAIGGAAPSPASELPVLAFVECNDADVRFGVSRLTGDLGDEARVIGVDLAEVRAGRAPDADLYATPIFHAREVRRLVAGEVVSMMTEGNYLALAGDVAELSAEDEVLVVCPSSEGVRAIRRTMRANGSAARVRHLPDWDATARRRAERAAAVLVSRAAIEMGALEALEGVPVRLFTYDFGESAFLVVREALLRRRALSGRGR
jgi:GntR family transcriptional regulator